MRSPAEIVENFASRKIAVAGDLMLDAYTWGKVNRISPEAPVPIVQVTKRTCCLGGGANVMRNLASLGAETAAFGVVGNDSHGETLRTLLKETSIDFRGVLTDPSRPTTFKERIIAGSQQLLRLECGTVKTGRIDRTHDRIHFFTGSIKSGMRKCIGLMVENEIFADMLFTADSIEQIARNVLRLHTVIANTEKP